MLALLIAGKLFLDVGGTILSIEDIYQRADEENLLNPIIELNWINISNEIKGDYEPVPIFKIPEDVDWEKLSKDIFG